MPVVVYVTNLPQDVHDRDVNAIFGQFGRVLSVDIKGGSRGSCFAFVEFEDARGADAAVRQLDGTTQLGSRLRVEISRGGSSRRGGDFGGPPAAAPGGYGGGGGGGGGWSGGDRWGAGAPAYDDYGPPPSRAGAGGYGAPPGRFDGPPPRGGYDAPPPRGGYGPPPGRYDAPPPRGGGYDAPPMRGGYDAPPMRGGYDAPPMRGGYDAPPMRGGYDAPPPRGGGYGYGGPRDFGGPPMGPRGSWDAPPPFAGRGPPPPLARSGSFGGGPGTGGARRSEHRVYVWGLPPRASWQDLKDHMRAAGNVLCSQVMRDPMDPDHQMGIIDYATQEDMENAVRKMDGSEFKNPFATATVRVTTDKNPPAGGHAAAANGGARRPSHDGHQHGDGHRHGRGSRRSRSRSRSASRSRSRSRSRVSSSPSRSRSRSRSR